MASRKIDLKIKIDRKIKLFASYNNATITIAIMSLKLVSADGQDFLVDSDVMTKFSKTIKDLVDDMTGETTDIPLPNVTANILAKVVEYCKYHSENPDTTPEEKRTDNVCQWDLDFMKVDQSTLFELMLAANYMDIPGLLDLACVTVANMIKGRTPEEIRKTFNIKNDFSEAEELQIRKENEWADV